MKISVVIPVYNVSRYISRCLDSVISQTYPNIECIIVDDRGTDNSMDIVHEKLKNYQGSIEFKVAQHERNRGLSAARNTGTDLARGEYVYYLDSDDLILSDTLNALAKPIGSERFDFVIGNYASGGRKVYFFPLCPPFEISRSNREIRKAYLDRQWYMMAWNKLICRNFLLENKLRFFEGLVHEDELWSFQLACKAQSMAVVNSITYIYCMHSTSIMANLKRNTLESNIKIVAEMQSFARDNGLLEDSDVARFVTRSRESLARVARLYDRAAAYSVYRSYVRGTSIFNMPQNSLTRIEQCCHLHHSFPLKIGYFYYCHVFRFLMIVQSLLQKIKGSFSS